MTVDMQSLPLLEDAGEAFAQDPFGTLADAQAESWIVRSSLGLTVLSYPRAQDLCKDQRFGQPHKAILEGQGITEGHIYDAVAMAATSMDGGEHLRLRRLISSAFTPRRIERHRDTMRAAMTELVDHVAASGQTEFVTDIAVPFPMTVICRMLGVPDQDRALFHGWLAEEIRILEWSGLDRLDTSVWDEMYDYLSQLLDARRSSPGDDLITALLAAEDEGDRLSHDEVIWQINMLLGAGQDTTRCQLALAMSTFLDHPDQWIALTERPELIPGAVDEVLRYVPTLMSLPKIALDDLEWEGVRIPRGTAVFISYPGVNRDPEIFEDPHRFDVTRNGAAPMTFGHGVHYCLGAMLARLELREALQILTARLHDPASAGPATWRPPAGVTGPTTLPLSFRPET